MFMVLSSWQSHYESSPGSFDECRTAPSGRRPKTKPDPYTMDPLGTSVSLGDFRPQTSCQCPSQTKTWIRP